MCKLNFVFFCFFFRLFQPFSPDGYTMINNDRNKVIIIYIYIYIVFQPTPLFPQSGMASPLIQDGAAGKELKLRFDVSQYSPEEIVVKTVDQRLQVGIVLKIYKRKYKHI